MLVFMAGASTTVPVKARYSGGEKIVREAVREFREQIGGGRRNHQDIVFLGHRDVLDRARKRLFGAAGREKAGDDFVPGERRKGERRMNSCAARVITT